MCIWSGWLGLGLLSCDMVILCLEAGCSSTRNVARTFVCRVQERGGGLERKGREDIGSCESCES